MNGRRFPMAPLLERLGPASVAAKAERLGVSRERVYDHLRRGVNEWVADELACRVGFHPAQVWPDWFDDPPSMAA